MALAAIDSLYNLHKGETALIIGNGPSLKQIPDALLESEEYTSFGCNRIWERNSFTPDYFVAVDGWVMEENELEYHALECPRMVPMDFMGIWDSEYYFRHRPGPISILEREMAPDYLSMHGLAWVGVTHAMLQIAFFMGFERFLLVGCDNTGDAKHFYEDEPHPRHVDPEQWDWGFALLRDMFIPRTILNISAETQINSLPRADWRNFLD